MNKSNQVAIQPEEEHFMFNISTSSVGGARRRSVLRSAALAVAALMVTPALAACGADSNSGSKGPAADQASIDAVVKQLDDARAVPAFTAPGPAVDAAAAKGKKIFYLAVTMNVPIVQTWWAGIQDAARAAGVEATSFDGKGQPSEYVRGFEMAMAQKYDVILVESIASDSVAEPIKRARAAGIKVIICNERPGSDGGPVLKDIDGGVSMPYADAAQLEADWVIADSKGAGKVAIFRMPNVPAHDSMVERIKSEFDKYGKSLEVVDIQEVAIPDWATRLPTLTRTLLTKHPDLDYIIPLVDGMALNIVPALEQANKAEQVSISTFNATPAVMKMIGKGPVKADVGGGNVWEGWAYVDQALRLMTGMDPVEQNIPLRMFDTTNVGDIDLDAAEGTWYDTEAAIEGYKKLWGIA